MAVMRTCCGCLTTRSGSLTILFLFLVRFSCFFITQTNFDWNPNDSLGVKKIKFALNLGLWWLIGLGYYNLKSTKRLGIRIPEEDHSPNINLLNVLHYFFKANSISWSKRVLGRAKKTHILVKYSAK